MKIPLLDDNAFNLDGKMFSTRLVLHTFFSPTPQSDLRAITA